MCLLGLSVLPGCQYRIPLYFSKGFYKCHCLWHPLGCHKQGVTAAEQPNFLCVCQQVLNHHSLKKQNKIKLTHFPSVIPSNHCGSQAEDEVISFGAISKSAKQTNPHHFTVSKKGITHTVESKKHGVETRLHSTEPVCLYGQDMYRSKLSKQPCPDILRKQKICL